MSRPCTTGQKKPSHHAWGEPCQLVEGAWELHQTMEPLATFTDAEVLGNDLPSNWQMITPSRPTELE